MRRTLGLLTCLTLVAGCAPGTSPPNATTPPSDASTPARSAPTPTTSAPEPEPAAETAPVPTPAPDPCTPPTVEVVEGTIRATRPSDGSHWSAAIGATVQVTNNSSAAIRVNEYVLEVDELAYWNNPDAFDSGGAFPRKGWEGPLEMSGMFEATAGLQWRGELILPGESVEDRTPIPFSDVPLTDPTVATFRIVDGLWRFDNDQLNAHCLGAEDELATYPISEKVDLTDPTEVEIRD